MIKQVNTNIEFPIFTEDFHPVELGFYQSKIRYLELMKYKYFLHTEPDGYYISTTEGMYCLSKTTLEFGRVREEQLLEPISEEHLTHYELPISKVRKNKGYVPVRKERINKSTGHYKPRISDEIIREIRSIKTGTLREIGDRYDISPTTVFNIKHNISYQYVI